MDDNHNLVDKLFSMLMLESLEHKLKENREYQDISGKRIDISQKCMELKVSREQRKLINDMLDKIGEYEMVHGDYAYRAGFYTCIDILKLQGNLL